MITKNPYAVALGKLAAGHKKNYSPAERKRRAIAMSKLNHARRTKQGLKKIIV